MIGGTCPDPVAASLLLNLKTIGRVSEATGVAADVLDREFTPDLIERMSQIVAAVERKRQRDAERD